MIKVGCYTKDDKLIELLHALYGASNVAVRSEPKGLNNTDNGCDIVIFDLKHSALPQGESLTIPVIVLTSVPSFKEGFTLLQRGVRGYGNRHMRSSNLQQAVDNVAAGQIWLPPDFVSQLINVVGNSDTTQVDNDKKESLLGSLSKREKEVALLVAKGMSNQEVADRMFVSLRTVKAHLSAIYEKTGVRNRLELGLALS